MYIDNYSATYVTNEANVYAQVCPPVDGNEEEEVSLFQGILNNTINEAVNETAQSHQVYTAPVDVSATFPIDSVPPVIKTQETAEVSYLDKYYPITEAEVISKIVDVRLAIDAGNLSAKTEAERYEFIEKQFIDAFGADFMKAHDLLMPSSMFFMIGVEYNNTLDKHISIPEQVNRERLHGDASTEEIQDKIRDSYPQELTNQDLFSMVGRMRNEGVLDTASLRQAGMAQSRRIMDSLAVLRYYARNIVNENAFKYYSPKEYDNIWRSVMNEPVNNQRLMDTFNVWKSYDRVDVGQDTASLISKVTGEQLDSSGMFVTNDKLSDGDMTWWNNYMDIVGAELAEIDALIDSRMKEIDAAYMAALGSNAMAAANINQGIGENISIEDTPESGEDLIVEESAGAEENLDGEDSGNEQEDGSADSDSKAA